MTTDNKTLADVQPGGRVRLGNQDHVTISDDLLSRMAYAIPGAVETTDKAKEVAARIVNIYLSSQPSLGGQDAPFPWENFPAYLIDKCEGDTISEEGLQQALAAMAKDERYCLAARQPVGQFKVVAYQQITPSADDPEVFDAKLWALPPGHPVPEGCTPLYWWTDKDAPPAQHVDLGGNEGYGTRYVPPEKAVDLGAVREALQAAEGLATICASVDGYSREEVAASGRAMRQQFADALAKVDSQAVGK